MTNQAQTLNPQEPKAIVCLCILAAYADGAQGERERSQIDRIVQGFSNEHLDLTSAYQDTLSGKLGLAQLANQLESDAARRLAYEMAVCVCNSDGVLTEGEKSFLQQLREVLRLDAASVAAHAESAQSMAEPPVLSSVTATSDAGREAELDKMILNAAILNGALEIMPQTLATMAIIPLQMRLVYRIGSVYGYALDHGHIKDFLATVGVGLTSQVLEGFTSRLLGGLTRGLAGGFLGGLASQLGGSAFAFASTYALGQVARRYYASGRTLSTGQLKEVFSSLLQEGRSLQSRYSGDITQKTRQVNVADLLPLVKQA